MVSETTTSRDLVAIFRDAVPYVAGVIVFESSDDWGRMRFSVQKITKSGRAFHNHLAKRSDAIERATRFLKSQAKKAGVEWRPGDGEKTLTFKPIADTQPRSSLVEWKDALAELPDADTTVLVGFADGESAHGYFDGHWWRSTECVCFSEAPAFWANLPEVPSVRKTKGLEGGAV